MIFEIILLIIAISILILLYIGIDLVGDIQKEESKLTFNFKVLLFSQIKVYSVKYPGERKNNKKKKKDKKDRKIDFKLIKPCIRPFLEFLKSAFGSLGVRKLEGNMIFGLPSYVSTAKYVGYISVFLILPNSSLDNTCLTVTPCFGRSIIDFKGTADVRINLLKLIVPGAKLILNKSVLKLIREGRK